jgi:hypothetical protein
MPSNITDRSAEFKRFPISPINPSLLRDRKSCPIGQDTAFTQAAGHFANPPDEKRLPDSGNRMMCGPCGIFFHSSLGSFGFNQPISLSTIAVTNLFQEGVRCLKRISDLLGMDGPIFRWK